MHYLIDGHNLIGKLPDIDLSDSDDEIKLLLRLKGWVAGAKQRQVTVVFDGVGIGGVAHRLSTKDITVIFAPGGKTADDLLIQRLRGLRNPRNFTLVSSDRRILDAAKIARIKSLKSEEFIVQMGFVFTEPPEKEPPTPALPEPQEKEDDPQVSDAEVREWLDLFGPAPKNKRRRRGSYSVLRKQEEAEPTPEAEPEVRRPLTPEEFALMAESDNPSLDETEVAEWMALFGKEEKRKRPLPTATKSSAPSSAKEETPKKPERLSVMKNAKRKLTKDEVDEWLKLFGDQQE
ncbi:MAG: NYN domain-containing protein [Anaerolineales bacterium]|nr:NYN domain-containing protein [Anaerolineales bacterium]